MIFEVYFCGLYRGTFNSKETAQAFIQEDAGGLTPDDIWECYTIVECGRFKREDINELR